MSESTQPSLTYSSYLRLEELLALQTPRSEGPEHDEMLFIVIHQVYELWFKQILHELDSLALRLRANDLPRAQHTLKRVLTIFKTLVGQVDILETMTPLEFLSFRTYLASSSGFQSYQFRELEFLLGMKQPKALERYAEGSLGFERLTERLNQPSVWDAFMACLVARGYSIPEDAINRDVSAPVMASPGLQQTLLKVYREDHQGAELCERLVDLDEGLQEWRYRHVMMVQRTIGSRMGTGESSGAEYLRSTLFRPCFEDLWTIRAEL